MMSLSLSLYVSSTNSNNQQNNNQAPQSFSEQIINMNKAIRTEYIRLSEQQQSASRSTQKPVKQPPKNTNKKPKK